MALLKEQDVLHDPEVDITGKGYRRGVHLLWDILGIPTAVQTNCAGHFSDSGAHLRVYSGSLVAPLIRVQRKPIPLRRRGEAKERSLELSEGIGAVHC